MLRFLLHANAILILKRWHFELLQASAGARCCCNDFIGIRCSGYVVVGLVERFVDCILDKSGSISKSIDPIVFNI